MAVSLGTIWFNIRANVTSLAQAARTVLTFGQTAQSAAQKTGQFQKSLDALSTTSVLITGPLGGIATRFQAIASAARHGNIGMVAFVGGFAAAAYGLYKFTKAGIDAKIEMQRLTQAAYAVTGNMVEVAKDFDYARDLANQAGVEFVGLAKQFTFLNAAAQGTNLEGERTKKIFTAVTLASAKLGLGAESTEGALRAIQQMMSKGTMQAEELRGQLGDQLPGAFRLAAQAMGVTTSQLNAMLKKGEVLADDFLPRFADQLIKSFNIDPEAKVDTITSNWARMKNSLFQLALAFDKFSGASTIWNVSLEFMSNAFINLARNIEKAREGISTLVSSKAANEWAGRWTDAFGGVIAGTEVLVKTLDDKIKAIEERARRVKDRWSTNFPPTDDTANRITTSELESYIKSQAAAAKKAAEGYREAQVSLAKVNQEMNVYTMGPGRQFNVALRQLNEDLDINAKVEQFSDALNTAGVATAQVTAMTNEYRTALKSIEDAKIFNEQTVTTFEYLQDTIGQGLTDAVDTFVQALENGKVTMETLKDVARSTVSYMLSQFLKLAVINPLMNSIFGTANPIFTFGKGGLGAVGLGNAAGNIPTPTINPMRSFQEGGWVHGTGPALLHDGERVLNRDEASRGRGQSIVMNINLEGAGDAHIKSIVQRAVIAGVALASGKDRTIRTIYEAQRAGAL